MRPGDACCGAIGQPFAERKATLNRGPSLPTTSAASLATLSSDLLAPARVDPYPDCPAPPSRRTNSCAVASCCCSPLRPPRARRRAGEAAARRPGRVRPAPRRLPGAVEAAVRPGRVRPPPGGRGVVRQLPLPVCHHGHRAGARVHADRLRAGRPRDRRQHLVRPQERGRRQLLGEHPLPPRPAPAEGPAEGRVQGRDQGGRGGAEADHDRGAEEGRPPRRRRRLTAPRTGCWPRRSATPSRRRPEGRRRCSACRSRTVRPCCRSGRGGRGVLARQCGRHDRHVHVLPGRRPPVGGVH